MIVVLELGITTLKVHVSSKSYEKRGHDLNLDFLTTL